MYGRCTEVRTTIRDGHGGGERDPHAAFDLQPDPLPWFTDQGYNVVSLAQDEARMLGQAQVEPEHVLLAAARSGRAADLLAGAGVTATAIHGALVQRGGFGDELVIGRVPHSRDCQAALWGAVRAALQRGVHGSSSQHLLLGLDPAGLAVAVLRDLGIADAAALVDARYPPARGPLPVAVPSHARSAFARRPPSPGPRTPVFERFTASAREAIVGAMRSAGEPAPTTYPTVEPAHLLVGVLETGAVQRRHERLAGAAIALTRERLARPRDRRSPSTQPPPAQWPPWFAGADHLLPATDMLPAGSTPRPRSGPPLFSYAARRLVAEDMLAVAHRRGQRELHSGHLLLAVLAAPDATVAEVAAQLPELARVAAQLP